jgi:predicted dehydrogenase
MPGHNYIYEDALYRMKDMIDSGSIGKITNIFIMYNIHHPESVAAKYPGVIRQIMTVTYKLNCCVNVVQNHEVLT